jgi:hypothetical protein
VVVEGPEDVEDPVALLRSVRERAPVARLFALVANAAHARTFAGFFAGTLPARAHPFVYDELDPLFRAAGWTPLAITPNIDPSLELPHEPPVSLELGTVTLRLDDAATAERCRTAAFIVAADRT